MRSTTSLGAVLAVMFIAAATAPSAAAAAASGDACLVLTPGEISATVGVAVEGGSHVTPTSLNTCTWTASAEAAGVKYVTLMLEGVDAYNSGKALMGMTTSLVITPVGDVGDGAYYSAVGPNVGLVVKKGSVAFKVAVYGSVPMDTKKAMEKTLAQKAVSRL